MAVGWCARSDRLSDVHDVPNVARMATIGDAIREALTAGSLAHLATTNADEIVIAHLGEGFKIANIRRDPRVALTLEAGGANAVGMRHYLIVHGRARITDGGAPELLGRLAQVYVGPGTKFPPGDNPPPGHVIRITPTRFGGVGPWSCSGGRSS